MKLNKHIDKTIFARLGSKKYPVKVAGKGFPSLSIGIGSILQQTLSLRFKNYFEVYSSDLYWVKPFQHPNASDFDMEQILNDIAELIRNLNIQPVVLLGHSAYGIVALEFAKTFPELVKGILMIGSPVNSNLDVAKINNEQFEQHAGHARKKIDKERREAIAKENLEQLDASAKFLREYIFRDAPRYWHDPSFDCTPLWEGIILDDLIERFFTVMLPKIDVKKNLEKIAAPIYLAAGMSDYDCCPWMWAKIPNLPPLMEIGYLDKSGHYPHYEEEALFDERLIQWSKQL